MPMVFVSLTRLRLRSIRFLPAFAFHAFRTRAQSEAAEGFLVGSLLPDRQWTFWTMTAWQSHEHMRRYMLGGSHRAAMPRLQHWCDEASVTHWEQPSPLLPPWEEADRRMRETGRPSKVLHPSAQHGALAYRPPRVTRPMPLQPTRPAPKPQ